MTNTKHLIIAGTLFLLVGVLLLARAGSASHLCPGEPSCEMPFPENAGPEIWVDGPEAVDFTGDDKFPDVAVDELGRRIHVWTNFFPTNPERAEIVLRRFDDEGNPLEDPRVINTTFDSEQDHPRVAVAADGSFLVIWNSFEDNGDGFRKWIRSRVFDSDGVAVGPDQLVSQISTGTSGVIIADVAALRASDGSSGGFVVVWSSFNASGDDDSSASIEARLVSAGGVPTGSQFQVNTVISGLQDDPAVAELADGGFLVVWVNPELHGRRFSAAGAPDGPQFQINTAFSSVKNEPDVAIGWDGVVAVVWEDPDELAVVSDEIRARLYDADLNALGPDFRVNTLLTNEQEFPRLGDYGPKGFLVTWSSVDASVGTDTFESIQARLMIGHDAFDDDQIQYNVWEGSFKETPATHGWYGRLGSAWRSIGNDQDPPPFADHITGRDIEYCLYCDDFEWFNPGGSGSLWRWTSTVGQAP